MRSRVAYLPARAFILVVAAFGLSMYLPFDGDAAGSLPSNGSAAASTTNSFCKQHSVVRDYLAPLSKFPTNRGFSSSGRLRVGPSSLRIYPPQARVVPIGQGRFDVWNFSEGRIDPAAPLNWWVASSLERVDRGGGGSSLVRAKYQFVSKIREFDRRDIGFPGRVAPGLYRLVIELQSKAGKTLDSYEEYFRALPSRRDLRLAASFTTLAPGQSGYLRFENSGTVPASYGYGYRLWNSQGEEVAIENAPVFDNLLVGLSAGEAGNCFPFVVPENLTPGEYRIGAEGFQRISGRHRQYFASFAVP
jgi:hypothetical protein